MDTIRIHHVFVLLFSMRVLWAHVVGASLLPPTNVTLQCHNMQNTLSWGYDDEAAHGLKFKVFVGSEASKPVTHWVDWPQMSIDLSDYSDPDNDYMLMVSAVKEPAESESIPEDGIVYSYFQGSPAAIICSLDLPSVNVTTLEENHLHFSFTHPGVLYPVSRTARKRKSLEYQDSLPVFDYHIKVLNQKASRNYDCTERICQGKLQVDDSEKSYCLNISGEMEKMSVRATRQYCSEPLKPPGINSLAYIIPIALLCCIVIVGGMVFIKKTRPSTSSPTALVFSPSSSHPESVASPVNSEYALPDVSSPSPLIPPEQNTSNDSSIFIDEVRRPLGVPQNDDVNEPELEVAAGAQGASVDGYTGGSCLEEEDEEEEIQPSAYEQRFNP